jgi:hypothetical protein
MAPSSKGKSPASQAENREFNSPWGLHGIFLSRLVVGHLTLNQETEVRILGEEPSPTW